MAKRFQSLEAQELAKRGKLIMAEEAEGRHLPARGRIERAHGAPNVNGPGPKVDGARLMAYDDQTKVVTIRVDHSTIPEFWLELDLNVEQLQKFIEVEKASEE